MIYAVAQLLIPSYGNFHWFVFRYVLVPVYMRFFGIAWLCCCAALLYSVESEGLKNV